MKEDIKRILIDLARKSIEKWVREKKLLKIDEKNLPEETKKRKGVFVTIYKISENEKILRGCIGFPYPVMPLYKAVIHAAKEACQDPRFPALSKEELEEIKIEVSVLSEIKKVEIKDKADLPQILDRNKGYIIKQGYYSGLFLPQVWKEIPDKREFLINLCLKSGLPPHAWLDENTEIYEFTVEIVSEV